MAAPILPSASQLVTAAINAVVAALPQTQAHFNNPNSNWQNVVAMWRAQAQLMLVRLADEVKCARLNGTGASNPNTGAPLRALCSSEFSTTLPVQPQTAYADVTLERSGVTTTGTEATMVAAGGITTISGLEGMTSANVGLSITTKGAASSGNVGTYTVLTVPSASSVKVANPNGYSGQGASLAFSGNSVTATGLTGVTSAWIGSFITFALTGVSQLTGTFVVLSAPSSSSVTFHALGLGSGTTASVLFSGQNNQATITGLSGMTPGMIGSTITPSGCAYAPLNAPLTIVGYVSPSSVIVQVYGFSGNAAAMSGTGSTTTVTGLTNIISSGEILVFSGAATSSNNAARSGVTFVSSGSVSYASAFSGLDANNNAISWYIRDGDPNNGAISWTVSDSQSGAIAWSSAFAPATDANSGSISWSAPTFPAGTIPAGTLFSKAANPNGIPIQVKSASYATTETVYLAAGQTSVLLKLTATAPGSQANVPYFSNYSGLVLINPSQPLFDSSFASTAAYAAGGSAGLPDKVLIAASKAYWVGQYGSTVGALVAGILANQSVRHFAIFAPSSGYTPAQEAAGLTGAYSIVCVADESWAQESNWVNAIAQNVQTNWIGFGCKAIFFAMQNQQITVTPSVTLADSDDLNDTDEITANVITAVTNYFDNRPDWYRWRYGALKAAIAAADSRILQCTTVFVTDSVTGSFLTEPGPQGNTLPSGLPYPTHYWVTQNNIAPIYSAPG